MFLFTVNAVDFVQISAAAVFCFLLKLKVLDTRMENLPHIVFRRIFLCCRKGLTNIEDI